MSRTWHVGIVGTFDVQNYGDLLFPILARHELRERLGDVEIHPFSYHARSAGEWPYEVSSVSDLPQRVNELDALLVGGGFLIRFDKHVADDYLPPDASIHHPTGYWLTPALMALSAGVPVMWNAPGMHCNEIPAWAAPLLTLALGQSSYIAVRDEPSKAALRGYVEPERINVVPDPAFALAALIPPEPSDRFLRLREALQLGERYLILQPAARSELVEDFPRFREAHSDRFDDLHLLALSIGPILDDRPHRLGEHLPHFTTLADWPDPLLLAELISRAAVVIGHSYHLAITALTAGVPAFTSADLDAGKFTVLRQFASVYPISEIRTETPQTFFDRIQPHDASATLRTTLPLVATHWDRIAACITEGRRPTQPAFGKFWQSLPAHLETASTANVIVNDALEKSLHD